MNFFLILICLAFILTITANPASERVKRDVNPDERAILAMVTEKKYNLKIKKDLQCDANEHNLDNSMFEIYQENCFECLRVLEKAYTEFCEFTRNPSGPTMIIRDKRILPLFMVILNALKSADEGGEISEEAKKQKFLNLLIKKLHDHVEETKTKLSNLKPDFRKQRFLRQLLESIDFYFSDIEELDKIHNFYLFRSCQFNRKDWSFTLNLVEPKPISTHFNFLHLLLSVFLG